MFFKYQSWVWLEAYTDLSNTVANTTEEQSYTPENYNSESLFTLAKGLIAKKRWLEAGEILVEYSKIRHDDFEANYLRGISFANSRKDNETNFAAIRALNDAIICVPHNFNPDRLARIYTYRGAMFKRLSRLQEAESDLLFGLRIVTREEQIYDIYYNLAGVYAQMNDREKLLHATEKLTGSQKYLNAIKGHLNDYFKLFKDDEVFLKSLATVRGTRSE